MYTDTCAMSPKCQDVLVLNYGKRKKYQFGKQKYQNSFGLSTFQWVNINNQGELPISKRL